MDDVDINIGHVSTLAVRPYPKPHGHGTLIYQPFASLFCALVQQRTSSAPHSSRWALLIYKNEVTTQAPSNVHPESISEARLKLLTSAIDPPTPTCI